MNTYVEVQLINLSFMRNLFAIAYSVFNIDITLLNLNHRMPQFANNRQQN